MKIWIKPVQEKRFALNVNREDKVAQLKASIERAKGFEAELQKLVLRGRALHDDATVASLNLHENDHLILLVPLIKEEALELPFETPFLNAASAPAAAAPAPTTPPVPVPQPVSAQPVPAATTPPVVASPGAAPIPIPGGGQLDLQRMLMELATAFTASTGGQTPPGAVPPILAIPPPVAGGPFAVGSPSAPLPMTPPQSAAAAPAPAPTPVAVEPALPEPKPEDMQMLTEMGFPAERAKKALWLNRMNLEVAMEWLLMNSEDADADAPLTAEQKRQLVAIYGPLQVVDPRVQQAVAANVCTFAVTGRNFTSQTWYQCYTCNLSGNEGCCETCARICHKGHQLSRPRTSSSFYCDCGAGVHSFKCRSLRVPTVRKATNDA